MGVVGSDRFDVTFKEVVMPVAKKKPAKKAPAKKAAKKTAKKSAKKK
jgi:hypothetical protein